MASNKNYQNFDKVTKKQVSKILDSYKTEYKEEKVQPVSFVGVRKNGAGDEVYSDVNLVIRDGRGYITYAYNDKEYVGAITKVVSRSDAPTSCDVEFVRPKYKEEGLVSDRRTVGFSKDLSQKEVKAFVKELKTAKAETSSTKTFEKVSVDKKKEGRFSRFMKKSEAIVLAAILGVTTIGTITGVGLGIAHLVMHNNSHYEQVVPGDGNGGNGGQDGNGGQGQEGPSTQEGGESRTNFSTTDQNIIQATNKVLEGRISGDVDPSAIYQYKTEAEDGTVSYRYLVVAEEGDNLYYISTVSNKECEKEEELANSIKDNANIDKVYTTVGSYLRSVVNEEKGEDAEEYYQTFLDALESVKGKTVTDAYVKTEENGTKCQFRKSHEGDINYRYDAELAIVYGADYENIETEVYASTAKNSADILASIASEVVNSNTESGKLDRVASKNYTASGLGTKGAETEAPETEDAPTL